MVLLPRNKNVRANKPNLYEEYSHSDLQRKIRVISLCNRQLFKKLINFTKTLRASLVAQWLRICLPMQGTRVRALVWEDPTGRGATRPVSHNY